MSDIVLRPGLLVLVAALACIGAILAVKAASHAAHPVLLALCLPAAVAAEIVLLRQIDPGVAYMTILRLETLAVLAAAWWLGDEITARQMLGGGAVLAI